MGINVLGNFEGRGERGGSSHKSCKTSVVLAVLIPQILANVATLTLSSPKVGKVALYSIATYATDKCGKPNVKYSKKWQNQRFTLALLLTHSSRLQQKSKMWRN